MEYKAGDIITVELNMTSNELFFIKHGQRHKIKIKYNSNGYKLIIALFDSGDCVQINEFQETELNNLIEWHLNDIDKIYSMTS